MLRFDCQWLPACAGNHGHGPGGMRSILFHFDPLSVWQVVGRIRLSNSDGRARASTYTGGVALCAHKAHHLGGGCLIFHWILGVGVEKSEKIAVSRGARLCDICAALHVYSFSFGSCKLWLVRDLPLAEACGWGVLACEVRKEEWPQEGTEGTKKREAAAARWREGVTCEAGDRACSSYIVAEVGSGGTVVSGPAGVRRIVSSLPEPLSLE